MVTNDLPESAIKCSRKKPGVTPPVNYRWCADGRRSINDPGPLISPTNEVLVDFVGTSIGCEINASHGTHGNHVQVAESLPYKSGRIAGKSIKAIPSPPATRIRFQD